MSARRFISSMLVVTALTTAPGARAQDKPAPADAAEKVGEGNTTRWLDYYRRERGQNWPNSAHENKREELRRSDPMPAAPGTKPTDEQGPETKGKGE